VFRVFALAGDAGAYIWWILQLVALAVSLFMLARRVPLLTALAMLLLLIPTVYEIGVGNLNSFLLLGVILTWRFATRGHEPAAGAIAAVMTAVKLTPGMMLWWLLVTARWRAVLAGVVTGLVVLVISVLGAGLVAIFLLRRRPAWSFGVTVLVMIYGSPAVAINWYVLLYALVAPFAWPLRSTEAASLEPVTLSRGRRLPAS
jgi:hypothetical protein